MSMTRLLVCCTMLMLGGACDSVEARDWVYVDPSSPSPESLRISEDPKVLTFNAHTVSAWVDCSDTHREFEVCLESRQLTLMIPRRKDLDGAEWEIRGEIFKAQKKRDFRMLGNSLGDLYVIKHVNRDEGFIYSPALGVVAVFTAEKDHFGFAMMKGFCGYGAVRSCYNRGEP